MGRSGSIVGGAVAMGRSGSIVQAPISMPTRRRSSIPDLLGADRRKSALAMDVLSAEDHLELRENSTPSTPRQRGAARLPHELLVADLEAYLQHEREYSLAACEFGCRYLDAHVEDYTLATAIACRLAMAHGLTDLAAMQHLAEVSQVVAPNDSLKQRLHDARQAVLRDFDDLRELCDNLDPVMSDELESISEQTPLIAFVPISGCNKASAHFAHTKLKDKIRGRLLKIHKQTVANACPCCGAMVMGLKKRSSLEAGAEDGLQDDDAKQGSKEGAAFIKELEAQLAASKEELAKERSRAEKLEGEVKRQANLKEKVTALETKVAQTDEELKIEKTKRQAFSQHLVACLGAGGVENLDSNALNATSALDKMVSGHCELLTQLFAESGREAPKGSASSTTPQKSVKEHLAAALAEIESLKAKLASALNQVEVSSKRTQMLEAHLRSIGEEVPDPNVTLESGAGGIPSSTQKGQGNTPADLRADLRAARQRIQLLESRLRALGAEVPADSSLGIDEDADVQALLDKERQMRDEADSSVKLLRNENQRLQAEINELRFMLEDLQAKAQGMQKLSIKKGVGDEVRHLMEESGLDVLTAPLEKGCRAVFARLYQDAIERTKRLAIMQQNWREADQAQKLAVLEAFSKSVEQVDPNQPGSFLDVDGLCQMVTESLGKRGPASMRVRSANSARMEKAVTETLIKRPMEVATTSHSSPHTERTPTLLECLRTTQFSAPGSALPGTVFRSTRPATAGAVVPTGGGGPGISREGTIVSNSGKLSKGKNRPMTASLPQAVQKPDSPGREHLVAHIPSVGRMRTSSSLSGGSSTQLDLLKRENTPFKSSKMDLFQEGSVKSRPTSGKESFAASFIVHGSMPRHHSATNL